MNLSRRDLLKLGGAAVAAGTAAIDFVNPAAAQVVKPKHGGSSGYRDSTRKASIPSSRSPTGP